MADVVKEIVTRYKHIEKFGADKDDKGSELLCRLMEYMKTGTFSNLKNRGEFIDRWDYDDKDLAKMLGVSHENIRVRKARFRSSFLKSIDISVVKDILNSSDEKVLRRAEAVLDNLEVDMYSKDLLPIELCDMIKTRSVSDSSTYPLKECTKEAKFLVKHCYYTMRSELEGLDMDKLGYLIRLLDKEVSGKDSGIDRARLSTKLAPIDDI